MPTYGSTSLLDDLIAKAQADKLDADKRLTELMYIKSLLPMCMDGFVPNHPFIIYCHRTAGHRGAHTYQQDPIKGLTTTQQG